MSAQIILSLLIGTLIGYHCGWRSAHVTVADECRMLGRFYVGKSVFHCYKIEEAK